MVSGFMDALQWDERVQEERGDGMIKTIVTFIIGAWLGASLLFIIWFLVAGRDNDEEMFTE